MQRGLFEEAPALIDAGKNWKNQTIWTKDNLHVLRGLNSATVDLIYLDPPFNSNRFYEAPIGSGAEGAEFKDVWNWTDIDTEYLERVKKEDIREWFFLESARFNHSASMASYLLMMSPRIKEMHRILKPTGSIYLHCDPTASHYLKGLLDMIFGKNNFRNEIVWCYKGASEMKKGFPRKHESIFFYAKSDETQFNYDAIRVPYKTKRAGAQWPDGFHEQHELGTKCLDWFDDIPSFMTASQSKERTGYPTQKPLKLLRRIIEASSNKGDVVLDPFCGCATTCVAAEELGREWIGIDISPKASQLVTTRIRSFENDLFRNWKCISRKDQPERTDLGKLPSVRSHKKHLYGLQEGKCGLCDQHFDIRHFEVDHIVPRAKGGSDHLSNLQLLCSSCNRKKGTRTQEEARDILKKLGWMDANGNI